MLIRSRIVRLVVGQYIRSIGLVRVDSGNDSLRYRSTVQTVANFLVGLPLMVFAGWLARKSIIGIHAILVDGLPSKWIVIVPGLICIMCMGVYIWYCCFLSCLACIIPFDARLRGRALRVVLRSPFVLIILHGDGVELHKRMGTVPIHRTQPSLGLMISLSVVRVVWRPRCSPVNN